MAGLPLKTFKIDRKSEFATKLKSHIFDHLLHFCSDDYDHILAEYITVLVCNGKNQNQAVDDLEAFLGDRVKEFVSWLWKLLLRNEHQFTSGILSDKIYRTSTHHDENQENSNTVRECMALQNVGNCDSGDMKVAYKKVKNPSSRVTKCNYMVSSKDCYTETMKSTSPPNILQTDSETAIKMPSSVKNHQTGEVNAARKATSLVLKELSGLPRKVAAAVDERISLSVLRNSPGDNLSENISKGIIPRPSEASPINRLYQSVWDRLGTPLEVVESKAQRGTLCVMDTMPHSKEWSDSYPPWIRKLNAQKSDVPPLLQRPKLICKMDPMPTDQISRRLRQGHHSVKKGGSRASSIIYDGRGVGHTVSRGSQVLCASNIGRKRHFGEISVQAETNLAMGSRVKNQLGCIHQSHKKTAVPSKSAIAVFKQVHAVKKRLRQFELEMTKLRSKQIMMAKDENSDLQMCSGMMRQKVEDNDSRTVVVNNVHHNATKETLSKFFQRCGSVASVDILTDENNYLRGASDKSASITFEQKEAADKALAFSGASCYSRTIVVKRYGEVAGVIPPSAQSANKSMNISHANRGMDADRLLTSGSHRSLPSTESRAATSDQTKATTSLQEGAPDMSVTEMASVSEEQGVSLSSGRSIGES